MRGSIHQGAAEVVSAAPRALLAAGLRAALSPGWHAAFALHRVGSARRADWQPEMTIPAAELEALVELLLGAVGRTDRWLTVCFDDGYADAVAWTDANAARFPSVDFLLFVNPAKVEAREGFAWDLAELELGRGLPLEAASALADRGAAGDRAVGERLAGLADHPDFRLATLDELALARRHPNVELGNHTDAHHALAALPPSEARAAIDRSRASFARLFGAERHFAFPFGIPGRSYRPEHVAHLRAVGAGTLWSTASKPFHEAERSAGPVLPRIALDGRRTHAALAAWILERAAWRRARGAP